MEDEELARHMIDKQIKPQEKAAELSDRGLDVDVGFVYTGAEDLEGWETVTCEKCGRSAQMPSSTLDAARASMPVLVFLCPDCMPG